MAKISGAGAHRREDGRLAVTEEGMKIKWLRRRSLGIFEYGALSYGGIMM